MPAASRRFPWTLTALLVVSAVLVWREIGPWLRPIHDPQAAPREVVPRGDFLGEEQVTMALFERWRHSAVNISTTERIRTRSLFGTSEVPRGQGSGFVWSEDGYVVTNYHVLDGAERAYVAFEDGSTAEGFFVGGSPDHDLAVLRINVPVGKLQPVQVGTSSDLRVGQKVLAIGNPFGLQSSLTTGVVSGLGRSILSVARTPINDVIQTDAAINPGNSGGPLLDSDGRLIGVNTAIYSPSGASAGVGFAVPVDTVNWVVPQIIARGKPERAGLGVVLLSDREARRAGIEGAVVAEVSPGSAAERAGLVGVDERGTVGDVIVGIDDRRVRRIEDLHEELGRRNVGDSVTLRLRRAGREVRTRVQLQDVR